MIFFIVEAGIFNRSKLVFSIEAAFLWRFQSVDRFVEKSNNDKNRRFISTINHN